jgi:argininosuccinate lyase
MKSILPILIAASIAVAVVPAASKAAEPGGVTPRPAKAAASAWMDRIDNIHKVGCDDWITAAWTTMLMKQGIVPAKDAPAVAGAVLELLETAKPGRDSGWNYFHKTQAWFDKKLGREAAGNLMIVRTTPPARQPVFVRYHLMKRMCQIYDLQLAALKLAEQHATTIMPGYTHERHAQPTTFGHYILSGSDAIQRSTATLEDGYHLMSLNELGCGALAGTSWPIDRDRVSEYLGMEGLIENANDAVGYADGFLVVACGLANVCNVASRMALEMKFWSGVEYGFLEMGSHGKSFLMPQKSTNPNSLEIIGLYAGQVVGHLNSVAIAGLREPLGDTHAMLHMEDSTIAALNAAERSVIGLRGEMQNVKVHPERMLAVIRDSYIASTELANQMVRDHGLDYRTAHEIIHQFVIASENEKIPATEARASLLEKAAEKVLGKKLGMTDARLRELLDPAYFINVTNSKGGVAPKEVARMIADRRQRLAEARDRHMKRIETLENAQQRLLEDLRKLAVSTKK